MRSDSSFKTPLKPMTDDVIPCSNFRVYTCHLNRWSFVFSSKCTAERPHIHVCAKCVNPLGVGGKKHWIQWHTYNITHSLMQTKVTVVSTPSLLFSLGQTTNRSNEKRERKKKKATQKIHKRKSQIFVFFPTRELLKILLYKRKIDIYISLYMYIHKVKKDGLTEMSPKLDNDALVCFSISSFSVQHFPEFSSTSHCFYTSKEKACSSFFIFLFCYLEQELYSILFWDGVRDLINICSF